jgi:hypothetical protein
MSSGEILCEAQLNIGHVQRRYYKRRPYIQIRAQSIAHVPIINASRSPYLRVRDALRNFCCPKSLTLSRLNDNRLTRSSDPSQLLSVEQCLHFNLKHACISHRMLFHAGARVNKGAFADPSRRIPSVLLSEDRWRFNAIGP